MAMSSRTSTSERARWSRSSTRPLRPNNHRRAPTDGRVDDRLERALGDLEDGIDVDQLVDHGRRILGTAAPALEVAIEVLADPYFPEVVCHLERLARVERGEDAGPRCPPTVRPSGAPRRGVGLRFVTPPLRVAVWARLHPLLAGAVVFSLVGAVFGLGFAFGQRR